MARYLEQPAQRASQRRASRCPLLLMTSGGGLTTLETARALSHPPGRIGPGRRRDPVDLDRRALRHRPQSSRSTWAAPPPRSASSTTASRRPRAASRSTARYRFLKGSGLPVRIPVIEMVEIGAGGGSIAGVDALKRITVGPESAGAEPGPGLLRPRRHAARPSPTPIVVLGRIDPDRFAGGSITLDAGASRAAVDTHVGAPLELDTHARGLRRRRDRRGEHGQCRARACRRARQRARGPHPDRLRRRARRCMPRGSPRSSASRDRADPGQRRRRLGRRLPARADRLRGGAQPLRAAGQLRCRLDQRHVRRDGARRRPAW